MYRYRQHFGDACSVLPYKLQDLEEQKRTKYKINGTTTTGTAIEKCSVLVRVRVLNSWELYIQSPAKLEVNPSSDGVSFSCL